MSNLEPSVVRQTISKTTRVESRVGQTDEHRAQVARAFLIMLVSREIQLSSRVAGWLRTTAQRTSDAHQAELAAACLCLTAETWQQREQLMALALRLVARRNRIFGQRRVNAMQLLEQPLSPAMTAFIELAESTVRDAEPGLALEILATVEGMLADAIPLAIELAGLDDNGDLFEAAELYRGRAQRAEKLRGLVDGLTHHVPERASERGNELQHIRARALDCFNQIARESAVLGQRLDGDPSFMC